MKPHILALLAAFHATAAAAQECSPVDFLKPETLTSLSDLATRISYVDAYHRPDKDKRNSKFMSDVFSPWGISGLDERQAKLMSDLIKSLVDLKIDERQRDWLLVSALSRAGLTEYRDCLQSQKRPYSVVFSGSPMQSSSFFLQVSSHPVQVTQRTLAMKLQCINGSISRPGVHNMSGKIDIKTTETVPILRDLTKPLQIHLTVGADDEFVTLPAVPGKTITTVFKAGEKFKHRLERAEEFGPTPYCVKLADNEQDAIIIPGSIRLHFTERSSNKGEAIDCNDAAATHPVCKGDAYKHKESSNLREACAYLAMQVTEKDGFASAAGYAQVQVAKAAPMSAPAPSASPPASPPKGETR